MSKPYPVATTLFPEDALWVVQALSFLRVLDRLYPGHGQRARGTVISFNCAFFSQDIPRPAACLIRLVREGASVCLSLPNRGTQRHAKGHDSTADTNKYIRRWQRAIRVRAHSPGKSGYLSVHHEQLAGRPETTLRTPTDVLGLAFSKEMLNERSKYARRANRPNETWKEVTALPVQRR